MKQTITGGVVYFDKCDALLIKSHSWHVDEKGYPRSRINGKLIRLHRLINPRQRSDHKNGRSLDNRRSNLRPATRSQNAWNVGKKDRNGLRKTTSKYKGVWFAKNLNRWKSEVWKFGKKIFSRSFKTERDAAFAYNAVAIREFGQYARLNKIAK